MGVIVMVQIFHGSPPEVPFVESIMPADERGTDTQMHVMHHPASYPLGSRRWDQNWMLLKAVLQKVVMQSWSRKISMHHASNE